MSGYDAVVVGASIAGTTAATLLARQGARVALLERRPDPDAYKVVCTHYMQAGAVPVLERLGILGRLRERGAVDNRLRLWTRHGWVDQDLAPTGLSITRRVLDPMLRELAASTPGVDVLYGRTVTAVTSSGDAVTGVHTRRRDGAEDELPARVVVGADGRGSDVARLARVPARVRPHGRFGYMAYFRGLQRDPERPMSRIWFRDPDVSYLFPNEDDVTVLACFVGKEQLPGFRADPDAAFAAQFAGLPEAPDVVAAERVSKLIGKLDMPNTYRFASRPGLAFAGDAQMAADPLWGVGCGFAFESAAWLADAVGPALAPGSDLDVETGLAAYRRQHRRRMVGHQMMMTDFSSGRRMNPFEHAMWKAAIRDPEVAAITHRIGNRVAPPTTVLTPRALARIARANLVAS
jgi:menaquinone-9 beta-reductase